MYKLLLCLRYLRTRYIALASIISVTLGVATMIVVNSVMAGFGDEMRQKIHGLLADVVIETRTLDGVPDVDRLYEVARGVAGDDIAAITATVELPALISFKYAGEYVTSPVKLIGIDPAEKADVSPLVEHLESFGPTDGPTGDTVPAERVAGQPPSWQLTDSALKRRRDRYARQALMAARTRSHVAADTAPAEISAPNWGTADDTTESVRTDSVQTADIADPFAAEAVTDPFPTGEPVTPVDPAAPLDARVFVGAGLISFPYPDPETGETRTHWYKRPGDDIKLSTVTSGRPPETCHLNATIVDVFESGMSEYDSMLVYCNIEELQRVRHMFDDATGEATVTALQLRLKDYDRSDEVVARLRAAFPPGQYDVRTWEQKQGPLLAAVEVESTILNVLLFLIIAVAGFGILAIFFMIVVEKTRDIGILKALGAGSRGVMSIFLLYGLGLGLVGAGVGSALGLTFVAYINEISDFITLVTGRDVFPETIYYFPEIPTHVHPAMVVWVSLGAIGIAVLASVLPARRAAALRPVEALRYE
ncbi:MAG: FtsX-like permease family protein [Planctomycetota bacterium]